MFASFPSYVIPLPLQLVQTKLCCYIFVQLPEQLVGTLLWSQLAWEVLSAGSAAAIYVSGSSHAL